MTKTFYLQKKHPTNNTIIIFDSGFGGLSIYQKVRKYFPHANYIYIFDNKNFPYGDKTESFIIDRSVKIITAITKIIIVSMVILACNTVTITSLITLRNYFNFPIIGVIPNLNKAIKITKNNIIGLLGTKITINHYYIQNLISIFSPKYTIKVLTHSKLVKIAEEKLTNKHISIKTIQLILQPLLVKNKIPDTIILGCTHFSFLKNEIKMIFPNKIKIVDSKIFIPKKNFKNLKKTSNNKKNNNIVFFSQDIKKINKTKELLNKYHFYNFKKLII